MTPEEASPPATVRFSLSEWYNNRRLRKIVIPGFRGKIDEEKAIIVGIRAAALHGGEDVG